MLPPTGNSNDTFTDISTTSTPSSYATSANPPSTSAECATIPSIPVPPQGVQFLLIKIVGLRTVTARKRGKFVYVVDHD